MNKRWFFLLISLLPFYCQAQLQIGIKGGLGYFWFTKPDYTNAVYHYSLPSYSLSLSIRQRSQSTFNHGIEIEYTQRAFGVKSATGGLSGGNVYDFSYTVDNLYLHFQPQFVFGSRLKFFVYPGIYFGALVHSELTGTNHHWLTGNPLISVTDTLHGNANSYYPHFEFGISPGVGLELAVSSHFSITFETRFNVNLTDIAGNWQDEGHAKMMNLNANLGFAYTFRKKITESTEKSQEPAEK